MADDICKCIDVSTVLMLSHLFYTFLNSDGRIVMVFSLLFPKLTISVYRIIGMTYDM